MRQGEGMKLRVAVLAVAVVGLMLAGVSGVAAQQKDVKIFGDLRFRGEAFNNIWDFDNDDRNAAGVRLANDDSWQYYRIRTHVGADARLAEGVRAYVLLVDEYRGGNAQIAGVDQNNIAVENAFLQLTEVGGFPLTLTMGRQNLIYGEGWLVLEGTPQDGSTTIGFDAVKLSYAMADAGRNIDLFGAKMAEGVVGTADDTDFYGLYITEKNILNPHKLEYYVLRLHQNAPGVILVSRMLPEKTVDTVGFRLSGAITDQLTYATEWGKQSGHRRNNQNTDNLGINAFAGYAHTTYALDADMSPKLNLGYWFYSGDGDGTSEDGRFKGWDCLFSEFPYLSELYTYSNWDGFDAFKGPRNVYNAVHGVPDNDPDYGTWTNMHMAQLGGAVSPCEGVVCSLHYQHWLADKNNGPGGGSTRGRNLVAKLTYALTDNVSTHLYGEYFRPGDYYLAHADDAWFTRWQVLVKF